MKYTCSAICCTTTTLKIFSAVLAGIGGAVAGTIVGALFGLVCGITFVPEEICFPITTLGSATIGAIGAAKFATEKVSRLLARCGIHQAPRAADLAAPLLEVEAPDQVQALAQP